MVKRKNGILCFKEAKEFVLCLNIKSKGEWKKYVKPNYLPSCPNIVYKEDWVSWNDWLGIKNKFCGHKKNIIIYIDAIKLSSNLGLKTRKSWEDYMFKSQRTDLPRRPDLYYIEWDSWSAWLGVDDNRDINLIDLRRLLVINNINTKTKYLKFYKANRLSSSPVKHYKLSSWRELFDADYKKPEYITYSEAKSVVHRFVLNNQESWYYLCKENLIPKNIPKTPNKFYKEWVSWNDWLGHSITNHKHFLSYSDAKEYIKEFNLSSLNEYHDYLISNSIDFLPLNPIVSYSVDYISSFDFLSTNDSRLSYGEKKIKHYLIRNNLNFKQQFQFIDCINKKPLLFDFYISDKNILIEFDGKQHFEPTEYFGGIDGFNYRKKNDMIKNNYCIENKIELIRISYEDINVVDKILDKYLCICL